jgi:CheY-like chemotaxis protein
MKIVIAEERSQNPPPIPITPYSAGVPPLKNLTKPITMPNSPPRKKTQTRMLRRFLSTTLVVIDASLRDEDGLALCRAMRDEPLLARTPIIVTAVEHPTRQQRLEALRAGAWDVLAHPFDPEEMLLRLGAYVRAKVDLRPGGA